MEPLRKIAVAGATGRIGHHMVDVLAERGYETVPMSRATGVDVIDGKGLDAALAGVDCIIDAATGPSPDEAEATAFFTTAARNLQAAGERAGARRLVVVSIVGTDRITGGYGAAKVAHERAALAGPIETRILRSTQFHEFVPLLIEWGMQGDMAYLPVMRIQPVAARTAAEAAVDLATGVIDPPADRAYVEVGGPREENLVDIASLFARRRGLPLKVEGVSDPAAPNREVNENGGLLPGPGAVLGGPTFEEWLDATG